MQVYVDSRCIKKEEREDLTCVGSSAVHLGFVWSVFSQKDRPGTP